MEELNRSVHTWIEESEHSGAGSDDGLSSPSAAGAPISKAAHTSCLDLCTSGSLPTTNAYAAMSGALSPGSGPVSSFRLSSRIVHSCRHVSGVEQLCYRAGPPAAAHDQPQPAGHHRVRRADSRGRVPLATYRTRQRWWRRAAAFASRSAAHS